MYDRLTRKELRIIEQTKAEGEGQDRSPEKRKPIWQSLRGVLFFLMFFLVLAFVVKLVLSWLTHAAG